MKPTHRAKLKHALQSEPTVPEYDPQEYVPPEVFEEMDSVDTVIRELNEKLYGPRYCKTCDKVQPVHTYKLMGSDTYSGSGTTLTVGFTGAYFCAVCFHGVEGGV